jgi:uncharacterized protein (TIGR02145 family)
MKKQSKKSLLWIFRGLLWMALSGLGTAAFAQGVEICANTSYTIANTVPASGVSTYQWLENGKLIPGASAATYTVPIDKVAGLYTYIRQAKSADCSEWQSSNEFAVTVFDCSFRAGTATGAVATFLDPRDGKRYKTVVMPDGRTWFAQNLNYTKDLTYNAYANEANGKQYISFDNAYNGFSAIGSYWCSNTPGSIYSGDQNACDILGALYTWETAMMVDGKYADESKTSSAWDESWMSPYYFDVNAAPNKTTNADRNNARGGTNVKGGGRGICPKGWHIPTALEWAQLFDKIDGDGKSTIFSSGTVTNVIIGTDVAVKLKSSATYTSIPTPIDGSWPDGAQNGTDLYGFKILNVPYIDMRSNAYYTVMVRALLAASSVVNDRNAVCYTMDAFSRGSGRFTLGRSTPTSFRCVKD